MVVWAVATLALFTGTSAQAPAGPPSVAVPAAPRKSDVTGTLPATLLLKERERGATDARLPNMGPRLPQRLAPSAVRWGHMTYSWVPPDLQFYAGLGEHPLSTRENFCYLLEAVVNGTKGVKLSLEVDASNLLLSARAAKRLGIPLPPARGGEAGADAPVVLDTLQVGPLVFRGVTAWVVTDKGMLPEPSEGVLPLWYLSGAGLRWESERRQLSLYPPETSAESVLGPSLSKANLEWHSGRPLVEATLGGRARGPVLLNLLSQRTAFDTPVVEKAKIQYWPVLQPDPGYEWVRGVSQELSVELGGTTVTIQRGCVADLDLREECMGVLGRDLLGVFDLYLDGRRGTVAFKKR